MSHTPHELMVEFPEFAAKMRHLKETDGHFHRIFNEYHELNGEIHRAETNMDPVSDTQMVELRKKRMTLKDEIFGMLHNTEKVEPLP